MTYREEAKPTGPSRSRSYQMENRHIESKERAGQLRAREQHVQKKLGPRVTMSP